jgi:predicted TIM-barrel fold metal-dependent hydrolase
MPNHDATPLGAVPKPPVGACDAHTHIFEARAAAPLEVSTPYDVPEAPLKAHGEMLDQMGVSFAVIVQPALYGLDTGPLVYALTHSGARLRGVAVAAPQTSDAHLETMASLGVKGLRFTETPDPRGGGRYRGTVGFDALNALAPRMRALNLHAQIWAPNGVFAANADALLSHGVDLVLDHMGSPDVVMGVDHGPFQRVLALLAEERIWVKLAPCRVSNNAPGYFDARPFHEALLRANPSRVLWGSDWPFVRLEPPPRPGALLELFMRWTNDDALARQILVDNPARLYGFPASTDPERTHA